MPQTFNAPDVRANDYPVTTAENYEIAQRLSDLMRFQREQVESLHSVAEMVRLISEKIDGHTKALLTVAEAAVLVSRHEDTIRRWIRCGKLKAERVKDTGPRGRLLIRREALVALLEHGVGEDIPAVAICASPTSTDESSG